MNSTKFSLASIPVLWVSAAVFLFGALALILSSGYTYGPVLLLLPALVYLCVRPYPLLSLHDKMIMASLFIYFAVGCATNAVHRLPSNAYDNFSRFLLAIPVLLLLLRFPVKPVFFWSGIALGSVGAAVIAIQEFYIKGEMRVGGHNNPIQFGDISMLFACLLMAGLVWSKQHSRWMFALCVLGVIGGIFASLLSGARGGWLALPVVAIFLFVSNGLYKNKKQSLVLIGIFIGLAVLFYFYQQKVFLQLRIQEGLSDLQQFTEAQNANTSLGIRFTLWHSGLNLVAQHPLLGWGSIANYVNITGDSSVVFQRFNHFHNEILDAMAKRGLLGGIALLVIYGVPALLFYRQLKQASIVVKSFAQAGLILVLASFVFGLTQSFFCHASGVMVYAFMLVILWAQSRAALARAE
ncbi:hypothetical protein GCM10011613_24210 [Cellvibrio zantedeschiae]|uniref:O-antigen ligase-related domain-containing protein n=1 Tax=Cellvibrio zantedeschiae TaxID=1237077 RepID=A0ABQ3B7F5_9GAMM|nr:O-antigen ligase family protein [Cellvibrio zantedeschiae]GGY78655.1 hypothetical protein GCM10011613_24210 [Cellvibrio zantedeschiae]